MPTPPRTSAGPLGVLVSLLLVVAAPATSIDLYDQQNPNMGVGSINYKSNSLGQTFVPALTTLVFVDMNVSCCPAGDPGPATLRIDIRDGGIAGPVIASSSSIVIPDGTTGAWTQFALTAPTSTTPGNTYAIELVHVSGGGGSWGRSTLGYADGHAYTNGNQANVEDMVFRTGIVTDVVPQTIAAGEPLPVEYSNRFDERSLPGGGGHGAPDSGEILYTEPPDSAADSNPISTSDFYPAIETFEPDAQVDALAHGFDILFTEVVNNAARLVVSFEGDIVFDAGASVEVAAMVEGSFGARGILYPHLDFDALDGPGGLEDVDGLDLWGPAGAADAFYYSIEGDASLGTSVWVSIGGVPASFISHPDIVTAVTALGYSGPAVDVDLDALMVRNVGSGVEFDLGDEILFSIRSTPVGGFDGGEIIRLPAGGTPSFLVHGGHTWDTAFDVSTAFDSDSEDVDAIEAVTISGGHVPSMGWGYGVVLGLALLGAALRSVRGVDR